jgi:hypothetical protein
LTRSSTQPPWDFLLSASRTTLQSYELSRLSHAANLRKEIVHLVNNWVEENSNAMLARLLMDRGEEQVCLPRGNSHAQSGEPASVSDNFLADPPLSRSATRGRG